MRHIILMLLIKEIRDLQNGKKPAHDLTHFLSPFCTTADTKPSQTTLNPRSIYSIKTEKESPSVRQSSAELPF